MNCPCESGKPFESCCEPFLAGKAKPETAEQLMRSRYTAYTKGDVGYLKKTLASPGDFDEKSSKQWSAQSKWHGLKILSTKNGTASDKTGIVEFVASYEQNGSKIEHHEVSKFKKTDKGEWRFVDGDSHVHKDGEGHHHHDHHHSTEPVVREGPKVGRNDPCPCGSGKKYKKCHGA